MKLSFTPVLYSDKALEYCSSFISLYTLYAELVKKETTSVTAKTRIPISTAREIIFAFLPLLICFFSFLGALYLSAGLTPLYVATGGVALAGVAGICCAGVTNAVASKSLTTAVAPFCTARSAFFISVAEAKRTAGLYAQALRMMFAIVGEALQGAGSCSPRILRSTAAFLSLGLRICLSELRKGRRLLLSKRYKTIPKEYVSTRASYSLLFATSGAI